MIRNILWDDCIGSKIDINEKIEIYWIGDKTVINEINNIIEQIDYIDVGTIKNILINQTGHFAFILKQDNYIYAASDIVCTYPLFYTINQNVITISNSAKKLISEFSFNEVDSNSLLEFYSCGYVTGKSSIYKNIFKLKPGELLVLDTNKQYYKKEQYYIYLPTINNRPDKAIDEYLNELENIMDVIFKRVIEKANGNPIWIPLSGGLDSRFIACKLKSLDYPNLFSFSYGPKGNYEAKSARNVAKTLNIPWIFIKSKSSFARKIFQSKERKKYWDYASGYYSLPSLMEYEALCVLRRKNILPRNAIIINGQTGDFITGGHIPKSLIDKGENAEDLMNAIITKHYSVWENIQLNKSFDQIEKKILETLGLNKNITLSKNQLASYFEFWEWQGRQSMLVVNGQRLYDYFGYKWMLPLWEQSLVTFYQSVPLDLRLDQNLFIQYLKRFNYKNLFNNYHSEDRRWNLLLLIFLKFMSISFRFLGLNKNNIYKYFSYWSHYSNIYAFYGLKYFLKNVRKAVVPPEARGVIALGIEHWLKENIKNKGDYL